MRQRVPTKAWHSPGRAGRRPRVLVEDDHPVLAISDFSLLKAAGFDVAYSSGPGDTPSDCPLVSPAPTLRANCAPRKPPSRWLQFRRLTAIGSASGSDGTAPDSPLVLGRRFCGSSLAPMVHLDALARPGADQ